MAISLHYVWDHQSELKSWALGSSKESENCSRYGCWMGNHLNIANKKQEAQLYLHSYHLSEDCLFFPFKKMIRPHYFCCKAWRYLPLYEGFISKIVQLICMSATASIDSMDSIQTRNRTSHFLSPLSESSNSQGILSPTLYFRDKLHGVRVCTHACMFRNDGQIIGSGSQKGIYLHRTLLMNLT